MDGEKERQRRRQSWRETSITKRVGPRRAGRTAHNNSGEVTWLAQSNVGSRVENGLLLWGLSPEPRMRSEQRSRGRALDSQTREAGSEDRGQGRGTGERGRARQAGKIPPPPAPTSGPPGGMQAQRRGRGRGSHCRGKGGRMSAAQAENKQTALRLGWWQEARFSAQA